MTTHAEFRRAAWRHWGQHLARCAGISTIGALMFFSVWLILERADPAEVPELRAEYAMAVAVVVSLAAAVMSARSAGRDRRDDPYLVCPRCNSSLGHYYVMLVLTSRNCPNCGERVLED